MEFQSVGDQVLQQLPHLQGIGLNRGQMAHFDPSAGLLDLHFQVGEDLAGDLGQIDRDEIVPLGGHPGERQQPVDQPLHPGSGAVEAFEALVAGGVELPGAVGLQAAAERPNLPQRLLEVVRRDVGEHLQLAVRALQLGGVAGLLLFGLLPPADVADEERQHRGALLVAQGHGHFGVEGLAVAADGRHLDPPAQQRALARVQVAVDAVLLAAAGAGRKEHVGGLGAQHPLARMAEGLLRRPVELGDDPLVVDGDDRIERGFEDGAFAGLGLGQRFLEPGLPVDRPVDEHQAGSPWAAVGFQPEELGLDLDRFAGAEVAQTAAALPRAGPVDGRHGDVAELGPGCFGVEVAERDGGDGLSLAEPYELLAGRVQIERLAVGGRQADEIGGRFGQDTSQRVGAGVGYFRPLSHDRLQPVLDAAACYGSVAGLVRVVSVWLAGFSSDASFASACSRSSPLARRAAIW